MPDRKINRLPTISDKLVADAQTDPTSREALLGETLQVLSSSRRFLSVDPGQRDARMIGALGHINQQLDKYEPRGAFNGWAVTVATNFDRDSARKARAQERALERLKQQAIQAGEAETHRSIRAARLNLLLTDPNSPLSADQRRLLDLRREGFSLWEIAGITHTGLSAVKHLSSRANSVVKGANHILKTTGMKDFSDPTFVTIEQILSNEQFIKWLEATGFAKRNSDAELASFRSNLARYPLSGRLRSVLTAHEPFGKPTLTPQISGILYGDVSTVHQDRVRSYWCEVLKEMVTGGFDFSRITLPNPHDLIRGIGWATNLTPTQLLLVYLIPRDLPAPLVSTVGLGRAISVNPDLNETSAKRSAEMHLNRLRPKIPEDVQLVTRMLGRFSYRHWESELS